MTFDISAIRAQFPILSREINGKPLAYLDNAASAQKPQAVIDAIAGQMSTSFANVHRGLNTMANEMATGEVKDISVEDLKEYRSERIGEKLQKAGFNNVCNLEGSIFKWVNEGYIVEDKDGNKTESVHGFDKDWGKWVKGAKVVY